MYLSNASLQQGFTYVDLPINFAGLIGTTRDMVRNGWELNLINSRMEMRDTMRMYFVGKHAILNLRLVSAAFEFSYSSFSRFSYGECFKYLQNSPVRISACNERVIVALNDGVKELSANWSGTIGVSDITMRTPKDFDDIYHFPSRDNSILIREDKIWTIEEHLKAIREAQDPMQEQILRSSDSKTKSTTKLQLIGIA